MRLFAAAIATCTVLSGCGVAGAATLDPTDDVHCSVLTFYVHGLAQHEKTSSDYRMATKVMHEWYAAKVRLVAVERWGGMAGFEKEVKPLLEAIKSDPKAMTDEALACADRAGADPDFNRFARGLGG